jgi:hypothetical protein
MRNYRAHFWLIFGVFAEVKLLILESILDRKRDDKPLSDVHLSLWVRALEEIIGLTKEIR